MTTTAKTILILAIVLGAGVGAYFLLKPKVSSASVYAREGGSAGAGDNDLVGYPSTTDNTPDQKLEYHRLGYTLRMGGSSSDMIILPFDKTTKYLSHQGGIIYVANGAYGVKWGLDMTAVDDGIEWTLEIQDNVVKSGKFLFKNIEFGKVGADFGPAIIGRDSSTEKVWWTLSLWVD